MKNANALVATAAIASGISSIALGNSSTSGADYSIAIGNRANATGQYGVAIGENARSYDLTSIVIGRDANSSSNGGMAIGWNALSLNVDSIAIGKDSLTIPGDTTVLGRNSRTLGPDSMVIGNLSTSGTSGTSGIVLGRNSTSDASGAIAIGSGITATKVDTLTTKSIETLGSFYTPAVVVSNNAVPVTPGTYTVDWNNGNIQVIELGGSITLAFTNPKAGASYVLAIVQPVSGTYTVTWPAAVQWSGGTDPTQTIATTTKKTDVYTLIYLGTTQVGTTQYIGAAQQNMS